MTVNYILIIAWLYLCGLGASYACLKLMMPARPFSVSGFLALIFWFLVVPLAALLATKDLIQDFLAARRQARA